MGTLPSHDKSVSGDKTKKGTMATRRAFDNRVCLGASNELWPQLIGPS